LRLAADRLLLIQETADAINIGSDRGIIVVGGKDLPSWSILSAEITFHENPTRTRPRRDPRLKGQELILMRAELIRYARTIANERLAHEFRGAGENLIEAGLESL
jgi:hypothetical protein